MTPDDYRKIRLLYQPFADQVVALLKKCDDEGLKGGIYMGLRTYQEQDALYAQGRTVKGKLIVTNAKGGQSYHNFGLAVDYVFKDRYGNWTWQGQYNIIGEIAKECGLEWGGGWASFKDIPHIQNSYGEGYVPKHLDDIYKGAIITQAPLHAVWQYLQTKQHG